MTAIVVVIPVLARPWRVEPTLDSLAESEREASLRPLFVCSEGDDEEITALRASGADLVVRSFPDSGQWARKINFAIAEASDEPWIFTGADDLDFEPGWADEALAIASESGARYIGTCDCGNPRVLRGEHSTHSLVARSYVEERGTVDEPGKLFHEGYDHQFPDDEAVKTAMMRKEWGFAPNACVCHLHPHWGKGQEDSTYRKGQRRFWDDKALYEERRQLWLRAGTTW